MGIERAFMMNEGGLPEKNKGFTLKRSVPHASGFTLTEMMLVLSIIAIMFAFAIPCFMGMQNEARIEKARGGARVLRMAVESYYNNYNDTYPPCGDPSWESSLMSADPAIIDGPIYDPLAADSTTQYVYSLSPSSTYFIIYSVGLSGAGAASVDDYGNALVTGDAIWESFGIR